MDIYASGTRFGVCLDIFDKNGWNTGEYFYCETRSAANRVRRVLIAYRKDAPNTKSRTIRALAKRAASTKSRYLKARRIINDFEVSR